MKAILNEDMLVKITNSSEAVEVGSIPKGAGLERLRFDGEKVIDLVELKKIWVKHTGQYELHAVDVGGCQLVDMTYSDRKNLTKDLGLFRIKTSQELLEEKVKSNNDQLKNRLRGRIKKDIGDTLDQLSDLSMIVGVLLNYVVMKDKDSLDMLTLLQPTMQTMYDPKEKSAKVKDKFDKLSDKLKEYKLEKQ